MKATRYPMVSPQLRDGTPLPPWVSPCSGMVCSGRRSPPCPFQTGVVQRSPLARRGDVAPTATGFGAPPPYVRPLILGWPKRAKNRQFLTPCGAKSWGSGGAPPTNLILLRNQRPARPRRRSPHAPGGGAGARYAGGVARGVPGPRPSVGVVDGGGWSGPHPSCSSSGGPAEPVRVPPCGGNVSTPSSQATTASSLRSSARCRVVDGSSYRFHRPDTLGGDHRSIDRRHDRTACIPPLTGSGDGCR